MPAQMPKTRRRDKTAPGMDPDALIARMPDELRGAEPFDSVAQYLAHCGRVADWLNTQAPGIASETLTVVREAAGVSVENFFRVRLNSQRLQDKE